MGKKRIRHWSYWVFPKPDGWNMYVLLFAYLAAAAVGISLGLIIARWPL